MVRIEDVLHVVQSLQESYDREMRRSVRGRDMQGAVFGLAGFEACERLRNHLKVDLDAITRMQADSEKRANGRGRSKRAA